MSSQKDRDKEGAPALWGWKQIMRVSHKQNLQGREQLEITLGAWGEGIVVILSILTEKEKN